MNPREFLPIVLLVTGFLLTGCARHSTAVHSTIPTGQEDEVSELRNPLPLSQDVREAGKVLYEGKGLCVRCHGARGDGRGSAWKKFHIPPRDFRDRNFWDHVSEGELYWIVKNGSSGSGMLEFESLLSDDEIWQILRYVRSFPDVSEAAREKSGLFNPDQDGKGSL